MRKLEDFRREVEGNESEGRLERGGNEWESV